MPSAKEIASAADAERKHNLHAKQVLCEALEAAIHSVDKDILKAVRESKEAWSRIGSVPRASEEKIDGRYKNAVAGLQKKLDQLKRTAAEAEFIALARKVEVVLRR